jgi:hypothetical protein
VRRCVRRSLSYFRPHLTRFSLHRLKAPPLSCFRLCCFTAQLLQAPPHTAASGSAASQLSCFRLHLLNAGTVCTAGWAESRPGGRGEGGLGTCTSRRRRAAPSRRAASATSSSLLISSAQPRRRRRRAVVVVAAAAAPSSSSSSSPPPPPLVVGVGSGAGGAACRSCAAPGAAPYTEPLLTRRRS